MCTIFALIGLFVVAKFLFGVLFPVTSTRIQVAQHLRTLDRVLQAHVRKLEEQEHHARKDLS